MSSYAQFSNVYPEVQNTIKSRAGNNLLVSGLKPWIRITSGYGNGLVVSSNLPEDNFETRYGNNSTSGKIGNNFAGNSVFTKSTMAFNRGLRPSPVIDTISIENGAEGLSRKLKFQMKCFSLPQLDRLTAYFLEPRFYLLAEWGWNTTESYSQLAKVQGVDQATAICDIVSYKNLGVLKDKRKNSKGHYDAFLGVITGGGIDYGDDETYILNVEVTTQGEIPAYLQPHKGVVKNIGSANNDEKSSEIFDIDTEIKNAEEGEEFGKALFMYMYNDLPGSKQIKKIKDLINDEYWTKEYQYINMNKTLRDTLLSSLKDTSTQVATSDGIKDGTVPEGQPLIGPERFIRMELAWKILNTIDTMLEPYTISCTKGGSSKGLDSTISIETTICRTHKHMFSANKEYLYVPNPVAPNFGLAQILTQTDDLTSGSFLQKEADGSFNEVDLRPIGLPDGREFPNLNPLFRKAAGDYDDSYSPLTADAYEWGYLKDLYINFDFFIQCMNRNGYVIKDVAIELLNGLSSAVNLFWDFQIVNTGSTSEKNENVGDECLIVVDKSFTGKGPSERDSLLSLQSIGTNSPFQEFKIKLELGGAIANQVMTQRNSTASPALTSDIAIETKPESFSGLFASQPDGVTLVLNTIRATENAEAAALEAAKVNSAQKTELEKAKAELERKQAEGIARAADERAVAWAQLNQSTLFSAEWFSAGKDVVVSLWESAGEVFNEVKDTVSETVGLDTTAQSKQRVSNYEFFMQKAGVYPLVNDPNADFAIEWSDFNSSNNKIITDRTLVCAIWQDSELLRSFYEYDISPTGDALSIQTYLKKSAGYLPIEVSFTIHGVSGIKVGDMIHFRDLPHVYKLKLFTVLRVEQSVSDDMWTTRVDAFCRNMDL